ncbi:MAG: pyruvate ferredoxin oxidoreductase subunit gamma [Peptococcaceae bacterium]|nr:pyruvate ferredoxin oxidoreductase subunit gamma [Peptococcaceae bacterium]MDH7525385.1 pyruvate ferredoxin oxidoreductase subunit gamma [Peptococcaceae bacterium]
MKEIRIHGRGGQGSVVTAELFAIAAFQSGKYSQAFPYLGGGGERRGAPVQAFARIDQKPIRLRSKIHEPDYVIVQDITLLDVVDVTSGLKPEGMIIINTEKEIGELGLPGKLRVKTVPATKLALEVLKRPIMNTALLGAFAAFTGEFSIEAIKKAIMEKFYGTVAEMNVLAAEKAYEHVCRCQMK